MYRPQREAGGDKIPYGLLLSLAIVHTTEALITSNVTEFLVENYPGDDGAVGLAEFSLIEAGLASAIFSAVVVLTAV